MSKHKQRKQLTKQVGKAMTELTKPGPEAITQVTKHFSNGQPDKITAENPQGKLVLTPEDKAKLEEAKALQAKALQAKIDAKEALNKAQEAIQSLNGSDAIKAIKQDIEARLKTQEDITSKALTAYQEAKDKLNKIQSEYKTLTGIDRKIKKSGTKKTPNGNGKFDTVIKQKDDCVSVLVTHKDTKSLFEYSLYPSNGSIPKEDWLKLRHSLTAQFERETKEENLTIRAYLSNLKTQIEKIKAIA